MFHEEGGNYEEIKKNNIERKHVSGNAKVRVP